MKIGGALPSTEHLYGGLSTPPPAVAGVVVPVRKLWLEYSDESTPAMDRAACSSLVRASLV